MASVPVASVAPPPLQTLTGAASVQPWVARATSRPGSDQGRESALEIIAGGAPGLCASSAGGSRLAVFNGVLYNRRDLIAELDPRDAFPTDADLVLLAYERWRLDVPRHLKGLFALVITDAVERQIVAIRDPLGAYPLFYAESSNGLLFSTSIDLLREQSGVARSVNHAALADHLCHRWPDPHETFFAAIRRVPPGYLLRSTGGAVTVARYWDPVPADRPVAWITDEELQDRFDGVLEQAVERALSQGRTGIFLSGGLDSISVGAMAADVARRDDRPLPLALSLGFPGEADEEVEQRGVAAALGLGHEFVPFDEAAPASRLLQAALDITRTRPAPLLNTWMPAYNDLALRGKARGVQTILSGAGGDEWLAVSPYLAADLLRSGDVRGLTRLIGGWGRSYKMSPARVLRCLLWRYGVKPLASGILDRLAPGMWNAHRAQRSVDATFAWVAPDRPLRLELRERVERWLPPANPPMGFYFQDIRTSLEHPLTSMELEEIFETGRRLDLRFLHPYWDADVVDILYRTPPLRLFSGGRAKSVVRATMARRFPGLGLDRQKKRAGTPFYRLVLDREIHGLWARNRDLSALGDLRIVEPRAATTMADESIAAAFGTGLVRIWDLMNLETWVRAHQ